MSLSASRRWAIAGLRGLACAACSAPVEATDISREAGVDALSDTKSAFDQVNPTMAARLRREIEKAP